MTQDHDTPETPNAAEAFDREEAVKQLHQTEAALREIVKRKRQAAQARARAELASNKREFAVNSLLAMEDAIFIMFDSGETPAEVLGYLESSMPGVPAADLRHALKVMRARRQRSGLNALTSAPTPLKADARGVQIVHGKSTLAAQRAVPGKPATAREAAPVTASPAAPAKPASKSDAEGKPTQHSTIPSARLPDWADWSDLMPGESDDDYIFRKALEMPPETQRKFIGEHNR